MIFPAYRLTVILSLIALSACAPVISSKWRNVARKDVTFEKAFQNPSAYTGSIVIWGGIIISVATRTNGTAITVLETPLNCREKPESGEYSGGRFVAVAPQFLDPVIYARGKKITVAGEVAGRETRPLGKSKVVYSYPLINIKQIHLWSIAAYAPPAYWWYGGPYARGGEWFGPGLGEEGVEEPGERGREEERESATEERSEAGRK